MKYFNTCFLIILGSMLPSVLMAESDTLSGKEPVQIGIYEQLDTYLPDDLLFQNEQGETVNLKSLIDKPTVFSLVYFNCPSICSPLLDGVAEVIDRSDMVLGKEYQVFTLSFNFNEKPALARDKKKNYLKQITKPVDTTAWKWFTGDSINVSRLTRAMGFGFMKEGNDYVHAATIIVVSPDGKITRYLYGTYFLPFDLKMAITEARKGISGPTINKVLKFCFSYDPEGKKYVFNLMRVAGSVVMLSALSLLLYLILTRNKNKNSKINKEETL